MKENKKIYYVLGLPDLAWIAIILIIANLFFRFGIAHVTNFLTGKGAIPIPGSIVNMYTILTAIWLATYFTVDTERMFAIFRPILYIFNDEGGVGAGKIAGRIALCVLFPLIVGFKVYQKVGVSYTPPSDAPGIHFDLPPTFDIEGPYDWKAGPELEDVLSEGGVTFTGHCQPCHGMLADGKGWMSRAWSPKPANFREAGTIAQLAEQSLFWRIREGGIGLPPNTIGYRSVMPRWNDVLSEEDVWKVIKFEFVHAKQGPADVLAKDQYADKPLTTGKDIFERKCWFCHGKEGDGNGPGVHGYGGTLMFPTPRDFTSGHFKIRTTQHGSMPTDEDLFKAITHGLPGSVMPAWEEVLTEEERHKVRDYVKTFNDRFKTEGAPAPIVNMAASAPSVTPALIEKGKELFRKTKCFLCHGKEGRANGPITVQLRNEWDIPFNARDLTAGWTFRGGNTMKDIFRTITTGLNGTPMGPYKEILTDEERWSIASFVSSISRPVEPSSEVLLASKLIPGELPMDVNDPIWQEIKPLGLELAGQMISAPRQFKPTINHARLKSVYNAEEIAFLIEWNDSTNRQDETFRDAVALQFPTVPPGGMTPKPVLAHGLKKAGVNIWHWKSFWKEGVKEELLNVEESYIQTTVTDMNALTHDKPLSIQPPGNQQIVGRGTWNVDRGVWQVVMKRRLNTGDENDVKFVPGQFTLFSLGIWDGSNGDIGSKKSMTVWYYVFPEAAAGMGQYVYVFMFVVMAVAGELWFIGGIRRKKKPTIT